MMASHASNDGMVFICAGLTLGALVTAVASFLLLKKGRQEKAAQANGEAQHAIDDSERWPAGPLSIYFGSQTGTAEGFAKTLAAEGARKGFNTQVVDLEDFNEFQLAEAGKAIFIMATYGEGDPTDNAMAFMDWLKQADKDASLASTGLRYTAFGLGNRQYEHYNRTGKATHAGLAEAGAELMFEYGEGDDDGTLEDDFEAWKEKMWAAVAPEAEGVPSFEADAAAPPEALLAELPFALHFLSDAEAAALAPTPEYEAAASTRYYWQGRAATVTVNRELRAWTEDGGSTRHVEVSLDGTDLAYETADNFVVLPENPADAVEALAQAQGYRLDQWFTIEHSSSGDKAAFPTPCTVREALTRYVDVCGVPRKGTVERLAAFAADPAERARLARLVSRGARDEFRAFVTDARRTLAELLTRDFRSARVPLAHLLHAVPHLQPREYTIASSAAAHPRAVHLTVALLREDRGGGRRFHGLCTRHLAALEAPGAPLRALVRASTFRLPADDSVPIILVGPGTGIAPMRALLQERRHRRARGAAVLYFGCRSAQRDYLYRAELEAFLADGTLTALRTAFSRDQAAKVYVQDRLREHGAEAWRLLRDGGAHVYVCGGTAMGADVAAAFADVAKDAGGLDDADAKAFMQRLHAEGRYVQELWS
eukprot:TRINITY_DN699_c0_g1_i4.p1 TRINITY_DN699_c0_g1~~TRINITY_DN699_c0_g1_i4.p1  ORF type:complete len:654 (-),score=302.60 TRINITY_DN699_c0_g1_i4:336-2297(-)